MVETSVVVSGSVIASSEGGDIFAVVLVELVVGVFPVSETVTIGVEVGTTFLDPEMVTIGLDVGSRLRHSRFRTLILRR